MRTLFLQGTPGNEGRRGEPGIPGCNGTKVSFLLFRHYFSRIELILD